MAVVRTPKPGGGRGYVGPFRSTGDARRATADPVALARAATRQRRLEALVRAGRIEVAFDGGGGAVIDRGRLVRVWSADGTGPADRVRGSGGGVPSLPLARDVVDEAARISAWIEGRRPTLRLVRAEHGWAEALPTVA